MVLITDYKVNTKENGEKFYSLLIQGGVEAIISKETGRTYLTAKTARVSCTFDETMCMSLIGTSLPGAISKVEVEPYQYVIEATGEVITRNHRYEYMTEEAAIVNENVHQEEILE
ncbi:MAG: hypothetical protein ACJAYP_000969 [Flavobacterium sp.]|jgi:hypothetical protein